MLRRAKSLNGFRLGALDGELGHIRDLYFDDHSWKIRYLVVETGSWLAHRKVLVSPHAFGAIDDEERILHVQLTREQVQQSPPIDTDKPVSRQFEEEYLRYFGWPFYWADPLMWSAGALAMLPPRPAGEPEPKSDPHLRSTSEVIGYHIQARDGEVGHVEDFLIDDHDWSIHELVVGTRNWLPGKRVRVSPEWIKEVSWENARVLVSLNRGALEELPEIAREDWEHPERISKAYEHIAPVP